MASFMDAFDEKKQKQMLASNAINIVKRKKEEDEEEEEAEYGDERRVLPAREFERLARLKVKMEEEERGGAAAQKTADGYLLQCAFCDATTGISCVDRRSGAVQYCAACQKTYRATPAEQQ